MPNIAKKTKNFVSHWYTRYLMATELYMVEPWEKAVIHVLFAVIFSLFWYFNSSIVLNMVSRLRNGSAHVEQLS